MRLINFGPGEIADRLTILSLKMAYGAAAAKPVEHFERERNALLPLFTNTSHKRWLEHFMELGTVNALIWAYTDEMKAALKVAKDDPRAGMNAGRLAWVGLQLQIQNERRSELITLINVNSGNNEDGAEKL